MKGIKFGKNERMSGDAEKGGRKDKSNGQTILKLENCDSKEERRLKREVRWKGEP